MSQDPKKEPGELAIASIFIARVILASGKQVFTDAQADGIYQNCLVMARAYLRGNPSAKDQILH